MERYFKRKFEGDDNKILCEENNTQIKQNRVEINFSDIPADPGLRKKILEYHPNERDNVRRYYLLKGPCQPRDHEFPRTQFGDRFRKFNPAWFEDYKAWLEYSITKDAAYCLFCYLYRPQIGEQTSGDSFDTKCFRNCKKKERFHIHVGNKNSAHNIARRKCEDLMNEDSDIRFAFERPSEQNHKESLFAKYGFSFIQLRGQEYDGASNMRGEFNGLKTLIMKENSSAYYVHCFAHQLQLALIAVAFIENFIVDMRSNDAFMNLKGLGELAQKMVETRKNDIFPLVFLLIKLALILPIATATVERAFSAMKIIKNRLRNRM